MNIKLLFNPKKVLISQGNDDLFEGRDLEAAVEFILAELPELAECHVLAFHRQSTPGNGFSLNGFSENNELKFNRLLCSHFYRENSLIEKEIWEE